MIILAVLFAATSAFVYSNSDAPPAAKSVRIKQALASIDGWRLADIVPLDPSIVETLSLDEYVNNTYAGKPGMISLYIGYYFTRQKVGAAHDPLVCLPGQGWNITQRGEGDAALRGGEKQTIHYSDMVIERGSTRMFVLYWFQADEETTADTIQQKIALLMQKFAHGKQDNAFVRMSMIMGDKSMEQSRQAVFDFIESFYPVFIRYVRS